jgi:hypothetical protein
MKVVGDMRNVPTRGDSAVRSSSLSLSIIRADNKTPTLIFQNPSICRLSFQETV